MKMEKLYFDSIRFNNSNVSDYYEKRPHILVSDLFQLVLNNEQLVIDDILLSILCCDN